MYVVASFHIVAVRQYLSKNKDQMLRYHNCIDSKSFVRCILLDGHKYLYMVLVVDIDNAPVHIVTIVVTL